MVIKYLVALFCVFGISSGQLLFKVAADSYKDKGSLFNVETLGLITAALALYGAMTFLWIWVLQFFDLARIYPLMALAFVIVPILSYFLLREAHGVNYYLGIILIIIGITLSFLD